MEKVKKIYVAEYNGLYKIGVSNNVQRRISQLKCGCPTINVLFESTYLINAFEIEKFLHGIFKDKSVGGEWFSEIVLQKVENIVKEYGKVVDYEEYITKANIKREENNQKLIEQIFALPKEKDFEDKRKMTTEEIRAENEELEKFTRSVSGIDVPNIYSDLIYSILFGKDTKQLTDEYKPKRFESFRQYLSQEQNCLIDRYTQIVGGLVNMYWAFDDIKGFIENI